MSSLKHLGFKQCQSRFTPPCLCSYRAHCQGSLNDYLGFELPVRKWFFCAGNQLHGRARTLREDVFSPLSVLELSIDNRLHGDATLIAVGKTIKPFILIFVELQVHSPTKQASEKW